MIVRALTPDGDWTFGKGRNDYLSKNRAIVQNISTRLNSFLGDCFFAIDAGIDWFDLIGSKNQLALELAVRAVILNTKDVTSIVDVSINLEHTTRLITMKYTVETIYTVNNNTAPAVGLSSFLLTQDGDVLTSEDGHPLVAG